MQPVEEVIPLAEPLPDLEFTLDDQPAIAPGSAKALAVQDDSGFDMDEFDRDFTESSVMAIDVGHDLDPLQGDIEQAVVLFANGQDAAARSLLETFIRTYPGQEGLRFWLLLFDLLQVIGDQAGFEKLGVEFSQRPAKPRRRPGANRMPVVRNSENGVKLFSLQGVLTAEGLQPLDAAGMLAAKQPR